MHFAPVGGCPIWFGLTQKQEARAGFDAAIKLNARVIFLQFKASNLILKKTGTRRYAASHTQMAALTKRTKANRSIFYCLPDVGETSDVATDRCVVCRTYLLDVASIPTNLSLPARKSGNHYFDLDKGKKFITIRSDPVKVETVTFRDVFMAEVEYGAPITAENVEDFVELSSFFAGSAVGLLVP